MIVHAWRSAFITLSEGSRGGDGAERAGGYSASWSSLYNFPGTSLLPRSRLGPYPARLRPELHNPENFDDEIPA